MLKLILWICLMLVAVVVLNFGLAFLTLRFSWTWMPVLSYTTLLGIVVGVDWTRRIVMG
jgi:hypothetical protein